ncbi:molybdenum cofactor biosynthesis protein MoaE [Acidiferrimicrobium sp. IK]|uniref:molybdenum cofactor biosynthesis protein MoaE n=1 Tax=Acidiferrimicrobium sp. IK TaxID=2871700 RepID=UPI0021CB584D|nr:molybdenum cofactor biosynthesis protein MoaE [Acidiferrimicrobium sp. IK]
MEQPGNGDDWVALTAEALPVAAAHDWVGRPWCGAEVVFTGTVRDHADGRSGVTSLDYEAYTEEVEPRLARLAAAARSQWPGLGRIVLWHRTGQMAVGEASVVVAVSAPHRGEAFDAARWAIDTLKESIPIWKHETWQDGAGWGTGARHITEVGS